jgi:hypothetical protein
MPEPKSGHHVPDSYEPNIGEHPVAERRFPLTPAGVRLPVTSLVSHLPQLTGDRRGRAR